MRKKLSPKSIDALPPATAKRYEVRDELVPGLMIRVSSTGGKVWYVSTRINERARRIKIGPYPVIGLADARDKAREILRRVQLGEFVEETPETPLPTFGETVPQFIELWSKPRNRTWRESQRMLHKFASLDHRPLGEIKRSEVVCVLDQIVGQSTPISANRALSTLKKLFSWAADRGTIEVNPIAGLKPPAKAVARDRVLTDDELIACWKASESDGFPFEQYAKLMILTGQRRGEVAGMQWSELDFEKATWTIPALRAKNATQHIVPLAPLALSLLKSVPRFLGSDFVFTTTGTTPISGFRKFKDRLEVAAGTDDWRMHDIRRTVATNMAALGVQPHVIEAVLNHKSGIVSGVAAVYNRHSYGQEKREALEKWAEHVEAMTDGDRGNQREVLSVAS